MPLSFGEHPYDLFFEFFIRQVTYLHCLRFFFSRYFSCSFIWEIFCLFIFFDFLCSFILIRHSSCLSWSWQSILMWSSLCVGCVCYVILAEWEEPGRCVRHPGHWPTESEWVWVERPDVCINALLTLLAPFVRGWNGFGQCVQEHTASTLQAGQSLRIEPHSPCEGAGGAKHGAHQHLKCQRIPGEFARSPEGATAPQPFL